MSIECETADIIMVDYKRETKKVNNGNESILSKKNCISMENIYMLDELSEYYEEYLAGSYDCVDRIVLSAYFTLGSSPGGFRTWWNRLEGSEEKLDNNHLIRMAGRFSRRVRAYAQANRIPVIDCERGDRKHSIAQNYIPTDPNFRGVFVIMVNRSTAPLWDIQRSKEGKVTNIAHKKKLQYVNHYSFHIIDPDWGHITIKMCGHPPFRALIMLNGHEYVACQAKKKGIEFEKTGNCFTKVSNVAHLRDIADTLCSLNTAGHLAQVCNRWIYSKCLYFALNLEEQERSGFVYSYSVLQLEYSRNLIFERGRVMEQIFEGIIDRTRSKLDVDSIKTIFGNQRRKYRQRGTKDTLRFETIVEKPVYNLTVLKINYDKITAKMYTKGECVLRIEIVVHNSKQLRCGKSLAKYPEIAVKLKEILNQFLNTTRYVDSSYISPYEIDILNTPSILGNTKVGGIDVQKSRMRAVLESVIMLSVKSGGFNLSELSEKVQKVQGSANYSIRNAAYDIRKLRGKNIIVKVGNTRRYKSLPEGLKLISALLCLREKVIKPVLSGVCKPKRGPKPKIQSNIDIHYANICDEMNRLFQTIGIAV
jgi:hypothetical protein